MEKLTNGGAETGDLTGWTVLESSGSFPSVVAVEPRSGANAFSFRAIESGGAFPISESSRMRQEFAVSAGELLDFEFYTKKVTGVDWKDGASISLFGDDGTGPVLLKRAFGTSVTEGAYLRLFGQLTAPADGTGAIEIDLSGAGGTSIALVDDASVQGSLEPVVTKSIRDALVADLNAVSSIARVTTEPVHQEAVKDSELPLAALVPEEGGTSEREELGAAARTIGARQVFGVQLWVKSETPHDDAVNLLDDVRNQIENSTSNLCAVAEVYQVTVLDWTNVLTTEEGAHFWHAVEVGIEVLYAYQVGNL